jgi:hypothetical protein
LIEHNRKQNKRNKQHHKEKDKEKQNNGNYETGPSWISKETIVPTEGIE